MLRYNALSHNSYLHPIISFDDIEDRASDSPGAKTAENGMVGQTKRSPRLFGGRCRYFARFVRTGGGDGAKGFYQQASRWVGKATDGHAPPSQASIQRFNGIENKRKSAFRKRCFELSDFFWNMNQIRGLLEGQDAQADRFVRGSLFEFKQPIKRTGFGETCQAREGACRVGDNAAVSNVMKKLWRDHVRPSRLDPFCHMLLSDFCRQALVFGPDH